MGTLGRLALTCAAAAAAALDARSAAAQDAHRDIVRRAEALVDRMFAERRDEGVLREAEALLAECIAAGNHRVAEYLAEQVVRRWPESLSDRHRYQRILLVGGERDRAERDLRELLRERPSDCASYRLLAGLLRSEARFAEAMEVQAAHLREHPGDAGALRARATTALWDLRDLPATREAAARIREAADDPRTPPGTATILRQDADYYEDQAARMERERGVLRAAEARVDRLLAGVVLLSVLAFAGVLRATRKHEPLPPATGGGVGSCRSGRAG